MKAITYKRYGSADNLKLVELPKPKPKDNEILIKIRAVSLNGSDKENLVGEPLYARIGGLFRPRNGVLGSDIAGVVKAVGKDHTEFKVGDEVFGELLNYHGGLAEYACSQGTILAHKPSELSFEQAAAIPQAGVIAYRSIVGMEKVKEGQSVLINGGGGSGGSFAIQVAKSLGAEVTAVDNGNKLDFMRELGADHVLDYTKQNFTKTVETYDFILHLVAYQRVSAYKRALKPNGTYYMIGGSASTLFQVLLIGSVLERSNNQKIRLLAVPQNREDLLAITELCLNGVVRPVIDKVYPLHETADAFRYMLSGEVKGKLVITL